MQEITFDNLSKCKNQVIALYGQETRHYFHRHVLDESEVMIFGIVKESRGGDRSLFDLDYFYNVEKDGHKSTKAVWLYEGEYSPWWKRPDAKYRLADLDELEQLKVKIENRQVKIVYKSFEESLLWINKYVSTVMQNMCSSSMSKYDEPMAD